MVELHDSQEVLDLSNGGRCGPLLDDFGLLSIGGYPLGRDDVP